MLCRAYIVPRTLFFVNLFLYLTKKGQTKSLRKKFSFGIVKSMKWGVLFFVLTLTSCAYRNPLEKADFRFQTLMVSPYVLSCWYRISEQEKPLVVYVESEEIPPTGIVREMAVKDKSDNVAYIGRPCQYFQTSACDKKLTSSESDKVVLKGIEMLKKKAATSVVEVKGLK